MELHSYAKLRGYKKWTMEQKRKLVETRINYDGIFSKKSVNCMDSWKKITTAARLTDFNVCFVRKQWNNLIAKYKAYKRSRQLQLGKHGEINEEIAREISEEWEFFYPIHSFMSSKTTNFHSYAQDPHDVDDNNHTNGEEKNDTDDPDPTSVSVEKPPLLPPNTDHDFYSKSASREMLDIKMDAYEFPQAATAAASFNNSSGAVQGGNGNTNSIKKRKMEKVQKIGHSTKKIKKPKQSQRDKYYKHKRRYDRRNERRFDALMNVFGQVVKQHFPNVDISKLNAQSDLVSTEDEESTSTICDGDTESSCTAPSSDESGL